MTEKGICPGCDRHCDLSNPACGKGRKYAETGVLPAGGRRHAIHTACCHGSDMNEKLIINLRDISHMMRMQYEGKASQKRILIILRESGALTQKELTERLGIQPGSASEILSKMENSGLIMRILNETDRRTTNILLTDIGRGLASEAAEQRKKRHEEMFVCLSSEEKTTLLSLLDKVSTDWRSRFSNSRVHDCHKEHNRNGNMRHDEES
ncbi:MAG: MarR family winged helix-turn-helix transcriptional regulator [Eubacteriales bacterium]